MQRFRKACLASLVAAASFGSTLAGRGEENRNPDVYAWGLNDYGQLGVGDFVQRDTRTMLTELRDKSKYPKIRKLRLGIYHSVALMEDTTIWTWGSNERGQLGDGSTKLSTTPKKLAALANMRITDIAAGAFCTFAVTAEGGLFAWGSNEYGQLGVGSVGWSDEKNKDSLDFDTGNLSQKQKEMDAASRQRRVLPQLVEHLRDVFIFSVSPGATHTIALTSDGSLWAWGSNEYGQLGQGDQTSRPDPTPIAALAAARIMAIAVADYHNIALEDTGVVWAWGFNTNGQLGTRDNAIRKLPCVVSALSGANITSIATGAWHSWAWSSSMHSAYSWGANDFGQLGHGDFRPRFEPTRFVGIKGKLFVAFIPGAEFTIGLTDVGDLYAWGNNDYGSLGLGDRTRRALPTQNTYLAGFNLAIIAAGSFHALAVQDCSLLESACSGRGEYVSNGLCDCRRGSWGKVCENVCPGVPSYCNPGDDECERAQKSGCSGYGYCDASSGRCECQNTTFRGSDCGIRCKTWRDLRPAQNGTDALSDASEERICAGHGICMEDGNCSCYEGYAGEFCQKECEGGVANPCSHLGRCLPDGSCECFRGYTGKSCSVECNGGSFTPCSDHGRCEIDGSCTCFEAYRGSKCELECPGRVGNICSENGFCDEKARCECRKGFRGNKCEIACPGAIEVILDGQAALAMECTGHGTCNTYGKCDCFQDYEGDGCEIRTFLHRTGRLPSIRLRVR
jgi:alpha-tubulin suppressor-like RCC1 family protein